MQRVPFSVQNGSTPWGAHLLQNAHERLIGWHTERGLSLPANAQESLPTEAIVAMYAFEVTCMISWCPKLACCQLLAVPGTASFQVVSCTHFEPSISNCCPSSQTLCVSIVGAHLGDPCIACSCLFTGHDMVSGGLSRTLSEMLEKQVFTCRWDPAITWAGGGWHEYRVCAVLFCAAVHPCQ